MRRMQTQSEAIRLRDLLPGGKILFGDEITVSGCTADPLRVRPGDLFIGLSTAERDTHEQARLAVQRGAAAILGERLMPIDVPQYLVSDSREAYGKLCHALAGDPCRTMPVIGVAGSLGKTCTSLLTASVLNRQKHGVATATTLAHCDSLSVVPAKRSTPAAHDLASLLAQSRDRGCSHAVVELTQGGLLERRTAGLELSALVFTNLRRRGDRRFASAIELAFAHLDHDGVAIVNADDPGCERFLAELERPQLTYAMHTEAAITARVLERNLGEQTFLLEAGCESALVRSRILGDHHVYNCLAAAATGLLFGLELAETAQGLEEVESIPGRMERLACGQDFGVFIDDALTHDGLAMALKAARQVAEGRVICVTSAPLEDSLPQARSLMGRAAERFADTVVLTGDGGFSEQTLASVHEMLDGFNRPARAHVIPGRRNAIEWAIDDARPGDVIVVAGQGHRTWSDHRSETDDATAAKEKLFSLAARDCRKHPLVFAYSG